MERDKRARWSTTTFLVAFAFTLLLLGTIALDFLIPLTLALSAAVILGKWYERLVVGLGGRRRLSALLMTTLTFAVLMGPLAAIGIRLVHASIPLIETLGDWVADGELDQRFRQLVPDSVASMLDELNVASFEQQLRQGLGALAAALAAFAASLPAVVAGVLVDLFVMLVALYSFFVNGPRLKHKIIEATPMERRYTVDLLDTIARSVRAVFAASFITAIIQGVLGYVGFRIIELPYALGLAGVMAFFSFIFSLVPLLGSGLVWAPVGVVLLASGRPIAGAFILLWGIVVLGSVDNVVKPLYTQGRLQLSPLIVFVTLFGGITVFGPIGALLGPLLAALAAAFMHIWTADFLEDAEPPPPSVEKKKPTKRRLPRLRRLRTT